jgi:hypothetical protein
MKILNSILGFLPAILAGVVAVEQTLGNAIPGAKKKQLVLSSIQAASQVGELVDNRTVAGISALIDHVVTELNQNAVMGFGKTSNPSGTEQVGTPSANVLVTPYINRMVR